MHAHPGLDVAILSRGRTSARSGVRRTVVLLGAAQGRLLMRQQAMSFMLLALSAIATAMSI
jgi:hypothetical protein